MMGSAAMVSAAPLAWALPADCETPLALEAHWLHAIGIATRPVYESR